MKNQEINPMEENILEEENQPTQDKEIQEPQKTNLKKSFSQLKPQNILSKARGVKIIPIRPKFIIASGLILFAAILFIAFNLINSDRNSQQPIENFGPVVENPNLTPNQELDTVEDQVDKFRQDLKALETDFENLTFPKVDLEIEF